MALVEGAKEAIDLQCFLHEQGIEQIVLFKENQGARELDKNLVFHSCTKHNLEDKTSFCG